MKRKIAILGSTGSIGRQALDVIFQHQEDFEVEVLTAGSNYQLLIEQAVLHKPNAVVIANDAFYKELQTALFPLGIKVYAGEDAVTQVVEMDTIDLVLMSIVGFAGLKPTLNAINNGKVVALANKESLVVAGELVTASAKEKKVPILPVDSEHSAIFQCLMGEFHNRPEKLFLTASGGPFLGRDRAFLKNVKVSDALNHPNWDMGNKITIDSASLMNKGLEVIEAHWLFGMPAHAIEVVVHPQSVIHSMVQFVDGSIKAQMGLPDMRVPIVFALSYPKRIKTRFPRFNFLDYPELNFLKPDRETFRNLDLAYDSLRRGGNIPCALNAANEVAVEAFLMKNIGFLEMSDFIESCLEKIPFIESPGINDYFDTDRETRSLMKTLLNN